jgi:hypothetical protein
MGSPRNLAERPEMAQEIGTKVKGGLVQTLRIVVLEAEVVRRQ